MSVTQPHRAVRLAIDRAVLQPFERGAEEQQVVSLPQRVVRRAREIDEDFLTGANISGW